MEHLLASSPARAPAQHARPRVDATTRRRALLRACRPIAPPPPPPTHHHTHTHTPQGEVVLVRQTDQPGIIAAVSSELATNKINISFMSVAREAKGTQAIMAIGVDEAPSAAVRLPGRGGRVGPARRADLLLLSRSTVPPSRAARCAPDSCWGLVRPAVRTHGAGCAPPAPSPCQVMRAITDITGIQEVAVFSEKRAA